MNDTTVKWTEPQKRVIEERGRELLVSAAAGSGKTAVLIERILSLLTDPSKPVDVDRLLVVTFTRAAADEMKDRLRTALEDRMDAEPGNPVYPRQIALLPNAQITTIDGFCSYILRSYGNRIGMDGSFRVAEEGEVRLLQEQVLEDLFEEEYDAGSPDFSAYLETYAPDRDDRAASGLVLSLYEAAIASPWPAHFLTRCRDLLGAPDGSAPFSDAFMEEFFRAVDALVREGMWYAEENVRLSRLPDGPSLYAPAADTDLALFTELTAHAADCEAQRRALQAFAPMRLSGAKPRAGEDASLREVFKANRTKLKEVRESLSEGYFSCDMETASQRDAMSAGPLRTLIRLTEAFIARFALAKEKRNIVDYADLEQRALAVLRTEDGGRTEAAKELAARFACVMIDEYQDSNYLQETILTAVSRTEDGENNYFMVGDIKQSIYRFRQARPELFAGKYDLFAKAGRTRARIDLHHNFRSRPEILATVNAVFRQLMQREVGGIRYDGDAALRPPEGSVFKQDPAFRTECMIVCTSDENTSEKATGREANALEAQAICLKIRSLVSEGLPSGPVEYRDIVILVRSMGDLTYSIRETLAASGIPVHVSRRTGYFSAPEVQTALNYLMILDNPLQDIPLAAVLRSPFASLSADELAMIRTHDQETPTFFDAVRSYADDGEDPSLRGRISSFLAVYRDFRERARRTPVHTLLHALLTETGFYAVNAALPAGPQRTANLDMLLDQAFAYENTSFTGLYHFVRYIRSLQAHAVDYGEAETEGSAENAVRIMTIHGSKGLEFPVVILAGLDRKFNRRDLSAPVLIHPESGLGSDCTDCAARLRYPTIRRRLIGEKLSDAMIGEELRVLYVAMTRARTKLVLTGLAADRDAVEAIRLPLSDGELIPVSYIRRAGSFFSLLLPALLRYADTEDGMANFCFTFYSGASLLTEEETHPAGKAMLARALADGTAADPAVTASLLRRFRWRYPYEGQTAVPVKLSVSELKAGRYADDDARDVYETPPVIPLLPDFLKDGEEGRLSGASLGTVYHRFLQFLTYEALPSDPAGDPAATEEAVASQLAALTDSGRLSVREASAVRTGDICAFLSSGIGRRMHAAALRGELKRETPFSYAVPADTIDPSWPASETVLIQGVIDAYFREGDSLILVDYKTDRVGSLENAEDELRGKYRLQLISYADALSRLTGLPVSERYIYAFRLMRAFPV